MNPSSIDPRTALSHGHQGALVGLLDLAIVAPILLRPGKSFPWLPTWLAGAVATCALVGALTVLWHSGALRLRFLLLFIAVPAVLVVGGWLLAGRL